MNKYIHKVAGIYSNKSTAENTRALLIERGFQPDQTDILLPTESAGDEKIEPEGNEVLQEVVKDGAIGTVVGGGVGALGVAALAAANISLFLASPLLGPLTINWLGSERWSYRRSICGGRGQRRPVCGSCERRTQ